MKNHLAIVPVIILCIIIGGVLYAEDGNTGTRLGVQMYSDSFAGLLLYTDSFELGLRAKASLYDRENAQGDLLYGGHLAYLFQGDKALSAFSAGVDAGSYLGDISYKQYIDIGIRLGFNQLLGKHFMLSGLLYPLYISTRETEIAFSFDLVAAFPKAAVAVTYLF